MNNDRIPKHIVDDIYSKIDQRSTYYDNRFNSSYEDHITELVECIMAAHLKGISVGLCLAAEMVAKEGSDNEQR